MNLYGYPKYNFCPRTVKIHVNFWNQLLMILVGENYRNNLIHGQVNE